MKVEPSEPLTTEKVLDKLHPKDSDENETSPANSNQQVSSDAGSSNPSSSDKSKTVAGPSKDDKDLPKPEERLAYKYNPKKKVSQDNNSAQNSDSSQGNKFISPPQRNPNFSAFHQSSYQQPSRDPRNDNRSDFRDKLNFRDPRSDYRSDSRNSWDNQKTAGRDPRLDNNHRDPRNKSNEWRNDDNQTSTSYSKPADYARSSSNDSNNEKSSSRPPMYERSSSFDPRFEARNPQNERFSKPAYNDKRNDKNNKPAYQRPDSHPKRQEEKKKAPNPPNREMSEKSKELVKPNKNPGKDELQKTFKIPKLNKKNVDREGSDSGGAASPKPSEEPEVNNKKKLVKRRASTAAPREPVAGPSEMSKNKKNPNKKSRIIDSDSSDEDVSLEQRIQNAAKKSDEKNKKGKKKAETAEKEEENKDADNEIFIQSALQSLLKKANAQKILDNLKVLFDGEDLEKMLKKSNDDEECEPKKPEKKDDPPKPRGSKVEKAKKPDSTKKIVTEKKSEAAKPCSLEKTTPIFKNVEVPEKQSANTSASSLNKKKKGGKGNRELDALNEDIDNMFIRNDVLALTGRRACTLAIKFDENLPNIEPEKEEVEKQNPTKPKKKSIKSMLVKNNIKPCRVALRRINISNYEIPNFSTDEDDSYIPDIVPTRRQFAVKSTAPKPQKPPVVASPGKGKKRKGANIWCMPKTKRSKKKKVDEVVAPANRKNTNVDVHAANTYHCKHCNLCSYKQANDAQQMVNHYKSSHPDSEILISRIEPAAAAEIKRNPMKVTGKFQQALNQVLFTCYFCKNLHVTSTHFWKNHIFSHTGEFPYKCGECETPVIMKSDKHMDYKNHQQCKSVTFNQQFNVEFESNHLYAHMCDTCHYVQLSKENVEKHVRDQHDDAVNVRIIKFSVFNYELTEEQERIQNASQNINEETNQLVETEIEIEATETVGMDGEEDEWEDIDEDDDRDKYRKRKMKRPLVPDNLNDIVSSLSKRKKKLNVSASSVQSDSSAATNNSIQNFMATQMSPNTVRTLTSMNYRKIRNIGFAVTTKGIAYSCHCSNITIDKNGFMVHLASLHAQSNFWDGYCLVCEKIVSNGGSALAEFQHMESVHIKGAENVAPAGKNNSSEAEKSVLSLKVRNLPGDTLSRNKQAEAAGPGGEQTIQTVPIQALKNIKIVRMPGTLPVSTPVSGLVPLSAASGGSSNIKVTMVNQQKPTMLNQQKPPIVIQNGNMITVNENSIKPTNVVPNGVQLMHQVTTTAAAANTTHVPIISSVSSLYNSEAAQAKKISVRRKTYVPSQAQAPMVSIPEPVDVDPDQSVRPWIAKASISHIKSVENLKIMLQEICLYATYKCMGSHCSYYTIDPVLFSQHLIKHDKISAEDRENYLSCAYCSFSSETVSSLTEHITNVHKFDKYQCGYCFYRSCSDSNVVVHIEEFHKQKIKKILETNAMIRNEIDEIPFIKASRQQFVPAMVCVCEYYISISYFRILKLRTSMKIQEFIFFLIFLIDCKARFFVIDVYQKHMETHPKNVITKCIKCGDKATKNDLYKHLIK